MSRVTVPICSVRGILFWILIPCLALGANNPVRSQTGIEARLRTLVEEFFLSYQKEDLDGLMKMWSEKSPDLATTRLKLKETFVRNDKIGLKSLKIQKVSVDSGKASMRVVIEMKATESRTGKPAAGFGRMNRTFHFTREGDSWKIRQFSSSEEDLAAAIVRVESEAERTALLEADKELLTVELVRALLAQGRRLPGERAQHALTVYKLGLGLAERLGDQTAILQSLTQVGVAYRLQGDSTKAIELFQGRLKLSTERGDKLGSASVLTALGRFYSQQTDYPQALASYQKGLTLAEELHDGRLRFNFVNSIGVIYQEQGDYAEALACHQKNLRVAEELNDKALLSFSLGNIGMVYDYQANYSRALEYYHKSLKLKEELGDKPGIARSLNNIGVIHRLQGNSAQALEYFQRSLEMKEELGDEDEIASALTNVGEALTGRGEYAKALEYLQKGLKMSEGRRHPTNQAYALGNLGILAGLQGNYAAAQDYLERTLELNRAAGDKANIAISLNNLGELHFSQGQYARAVEMLDQAAMLANQINLAELVWMSNALLGRAHRALNRPDRARHSFLTAIDTIEELRGQVGGGEQEGQRSFENRLAAYHGMVDLLVDQNNAAEALLYAERAKGRALLDVLQAGRINISKALTGEEQRQEQELRSQTVSLSLALQREQPREPPDEARLRDLEARLQKKRLEYEALQAGLYAAHPNLKVQRGRMQPLAMDEIVRLIPDSRTALVEFVVRDDKSFLFVLTGKHRTAQAKIDLRVYPLNANKKQLADLTQRFHRALAERRLNLQTLAAQLYDMLLKPARVQLEGINALIIVPDDVLWQLPFQALSPSNNRYLIEDYAISYAPSLTVLREMLRQQPLRANPTRTGPTLLAFGNPVPGTETVARARTVLMDAPLEPLPEAEKQVRLLGQLYGAQGSRIYTGSSAQEERFKAEAGNYRILHLATHGILNNTNPMYSQLVLTSSDGNREDGLLEAWEIMNLDLKADLVVLSACETAGGRVGAGEGMIGLSWALFVAGAPTVVVSQWKVEATSSTELLLEFHRQLRINSRRKGSRYDSAVALRQAALKLLRSKKYDHPFYWAPFVTIGNARGSHLVDGN